MDPKPKIIERKPRELRNDNEEQEGRRPSRKNTQSSDPGNSDHLSGEDAEGDSDVEECYQQARQEQSNAKYGSTNSDEGSNDATPGDDENDEGQEPSEKKLKSKEHFPDLIGRLEVKVDRLLKDNAAIRKENETLLDDKTLLELRLESFEKESGESESLRSRNIRLERRLAAVQEKLLWDYYSKKHPAEEAKLKAYHNNGDWLANDRIVDELLFDFVALGTRNAELLTENNKLHANLDTLQRSALNNVERFQPTQDDEIVEHFDGLASAIRLLTRDIPTSVDPQTLADMFGSWSLLRDVSPSFWETKQHKRCLLEAAIWSMLMDTVFSTPFFIFGGAHGSVCMQQWMELFARRETLEAASDTGTFHWPAPSPLCEKWRYVTIEQLGNKTVGGSSDGPNAVAVDKVIESSYLDAKNGIEKLLTDSLSSIAPAIKPIKIQRIIKKSWDLAIEIGKQRCRLQLVSPELHEEYVAGESTSLMGISGCENIRNGRVAFVANPGLRKWGDGHGANLEHFFDLKPALVYIEGK